MEKLKILFNKRIVGCQNTIKLGELVLEYFESIPRIKSLRVLCLRVIKQRKNGLYDYAHNSDNYPQILLEW
jgi:hypothetical protein